MQAIQTNHFIIQVDSDLAEIVPPYIENRRADVADLEVALQGPHVLEGVETGPAGLERARMVGHQLKGSGRSFGLDELSRLGALLELAAKENDLEAARAIVVSVSAYLRGVEVVFDEPC